MGPHQLQQILCLSVDERIHLVEAIWDSIAENQESLTVTDAPRVEMDRRLTAHLRDRGAARPWR